MKNLSVALMILGVTIVVCALLLHRQGWSWLGLGVAWIGELLPRAVTVPVIPRDHHRPVAARVVDRAQPREKSA